MTAAPLPAEIPTPRHAAPEEDAQLRIAEQEEHTRRGRHAAPEEETAEDPLAWLGFRFEAV